MTRKDQVKVFVLYRVIQHWRVPIFERIANLPKVDFNIVHGPDFPGTKVLNSKGRITFKSRKLFSFKILKKSTNGTIAMPLSPFLFFFLCIKQPDVVISEGASNFLNAVQGYLYCKLFNKKFIWWSLGKLQKREYDISRKKIDRVVRHIECTSDAIISYSTLGKKYFESLGIAPERIFVAVNVVDTDSKIEIMRSSDVSQIYDDAHIINSFNILFVGALNKEKKVDVLIKAFKKLELVNKDVYLNIVGDGDYKSTLEELCRALNVHNVSFRGNLVQGVEKYFIGSDVFVLPGLGGLAVSEAMAYGLPVIASIGDGCEADLIDQDNGYLDQDLDEQRLFVYLQELYSNRELLNNKKASSKEKILNSYNVGNYVKQINSAIKYAINESDS